MVGNCTKGCRRYLYNAKELIESHQLGGIQGKLKRVFKICMAYFYYEILTLRGLCEMGTPVTEEKGLYMPPKQLCFRIYENTKG